MHPAPPHSSLILCLLLALSACTPEGPEEPPAANLSRESAAAALRSAAEFYRGQVSTEGAYHFVYSEDITYGRSEQARGLTQASVQRILEGLIWATLEP